jgi:branched-chain amino acid transport system substrate-binding protein
MRSNRARFLTVTAAAALMAATAAGCSSSTSTGGSTGGGGGGGKSSTPITIGTSLSLTGDFSVDGQAFEKGYKLWASQVNKAGGIDGHKVELTILNDNSSQTQVVTS